MTTNEHCFQNPTQRPGHYSNPPAQPSRVVQRRPGGVLVSPRKDCDHPQSGDRFAPDDEYTPEQRRIIDARLDESEEDLKKGRTYGPFNTADERLITALAESLLLPFPPSATFRPLYFPQKSGFLTSRN